MYFKLNVSMTLRDLVQVKMYFAKYVTGVNIYRLTFSFPYIVNVRSLSMYGKGSKYFKCVLIHCIFPVSGQVSLGLLLASVSRGASDGSLQ